jgi:hypothetical protein
MRRYYTVPLILLILSIINFALAAPVLIPERCQVCVGVARVPKDVITVLRKRGDRLEMMEKLFKDFDRLWGSSPRLPSSSAPLESGHGSMQVQVPPASPASSTESDWDPESLVWHPPAHPPTPITASSTEHDSEDESMPSLVSASDLDRESMDADHDAPASGPESSMGSGPSHTLPPTPESSTGSEHWYTPPSTPGGSNSESEHWYTPPSSPDSGRFPIGMHSSGSDSDRRSTISRMRRAFQTANDALKGKAKVWRRITGTASGAANAAQSELQYV